MALFSERPAIPRETVNQLNEDGTLGPPIAEEMVSREGLIREMDVDVIMDINSAIIIRAWLDRRIQEYQLPDSEEK
ncbi:MAG: hypothetical protein GY731_09675 [Gammaproteobacteria bacterium]|nr:hypothetical protein [Gammaproteobacteria bacterium]